MPRVWAVLILSWNTRALFTTLKKEHHKKKNQNSAGRYRGAQFTSFLKSKREPRNGRAFWRCSSGLQFDGARFR